MEINGKAIAVIFILLLLFVSTLGMFVFNGKATNSSSDSMAGHNGGNSMLTNTQTGNEYSDLPEKCRPPAEQDVNSWKEHLGHHRDLQECLKYFN